MNNSLKVSQGKTLGRNDLGLVVSPLLLLVLWLGLASPESAFAAPAAVEIVRSGDMPPGGNGRYENFSSPTINLGGTLIFSARLFETENDNLDDSGIYRTFRPQTLGPLITTLDEVFREGETYFIGDTQYSLGDIYLTNFLLQDTPISSFVSPAAGQFNAMTVRLDVTDGNSNGNSLLAVEDDQGTWQLVVAAGDDVPAGTGTFREISNFAPAGISQTLGVSFGASLDGTPNGSDDNVALFRYVADGTLQEVVRKGTPSNAGTFSLVGSIRPNSFGGFALIGVDDSGDAANDTAIFRVSPFSPALIRVVGEGDSAPTDDPDPRVFSAVTEHRINNNDSVGFAGRLRDLATGFSIQNGSGLYRANSGGVVTEVVREGQLIPDGSARYQRFASSSSGDVPRSPFNDLDQFAFVVRTNVEGGGGQSSGLFRASDSEVVQIALEGDPYEDGTLLGFRRDPALNNQGLVVFDVELNVGTEIGDEGQFIVTNQLLVLTNGEDFATIAREGEQIGSGTVREIFFNNNPRGPANGLNDHGAVSFEVLYDDGSRGIILWRPELGWQSASEDGQWDDPANWFFNIPPNLNTNVSIDTDTNSNVAGPGADTTVNALSLGNGSGQVALTLSAGGVGTSEGTTIGANGTVTVSANMTITVGGPVENRGVIELGENSGLTLEGPYSGSGSIIGADGVVVFQAGVAPGDA